jgi:hypothetical protein
MLPLGCAGLPARRSRPALEWSYDVICDPASVKVARLGLDSLTIHVTGIHLPWIKGHVSLDSLVTGRRVWVEPGSVFHLPAPYA